MIAVRENRNTRREICPSATTNPSRIALGLNPDLFGWKLTTNRWSYGRVCFVWNVSRVFRRILDFEEIMDSIFLCI
jgi:hypothetical protein